MATLEPFDATPRPPAARRWLRAAWAVTWRLSAWFVLTGLLAAPGIVALRVGLPNWVRQHPLGTQICGDFTMAFALLLASWLMARFVDHAPAAVLGLSPRRAVRLACGGILLGMAWIAASVGTAWLAGCLSWGPSGHLALLPLLGVSVSLAANALAQQLLLNGYVLHVLRDRVGLPAAAVLSAALFSLYHAPAFHGAWLPPLNVFAAGLLFILARSASGSLWLPTGMHAAWNILLGPGLGLSVSGTEELAQGWRVFVVRGPDLLTGGAFGLEGGLFVSLTTGVAVAVLAARMRRAAGNA